MVVTLSIMPLRGRNACHNMPGASFNENAERLNGFCTPPQRLQRMNLADAGGVAVQPVVKGKVVEIERLLCIACFEENRAQLAM